MSEESLLIHLENADKDLAALRARVSELEAQAQTDKERLDWCLRYACGRQIGSGSADFDYIPLTLELIDKAIAYQKKE